MVGRQVGVLGGRQKNGELCLSCSFLTYPPTYLSIYPYQVLGIDRRADTSEVKKAYRTLAKVYHPDKQADSSVEEKEKAEKEFLKVAQAYEILSNDELR